MYLVDSRLRIRSFYPRGYRGWNSSSHRNQRVGQRSVERAKWVERVCGVGMLNRNRRKSEVERTGTSVIVDRLPVRPSLLLENLAETSHLRPPLPSPHDGYVMIPRAASSVTKRRITLSSPVLQRDASTGPSVDVKARTVLSRLPVPPLRSTLDKYLQSIKPLLLEDDLRGVSAFDLAYQQRVQWAKEFEVGIGATLQARLIGICCVLSTFSAVPSHT